MYKALIEIGWVQKWFSGETVEEIVSQIERYQDFGCMMMFGRNLENPAGQKALDKLELFLDKYGKRKLTIDDLRELDLHLSIGNFICHEVVEESADEAPGNSN